MTLPIRHLPMLLLASAFAFGASATAFAGNAAMTPDNDPQSESDQPVADAWITTKVKAELATTEGVSAMDINVDTKDGVVSLIGVVDNSTVIDKAIAAARSIKGVQSVDSSGLKTE